MSQTQMIGHYRIVELLGAGAMGNVHLAVDTLIDREVAIKSLRPELTRDQESFQRLRAEARSLARLNHPNITTLHQLLDSDNLYMVMELVRGRPLDDILRDRRRPLGVTESLAIIAQAADGLSYAHRMSVIHRDIKPSNLMIADDGRVKIMDFGIARVHGSVRLTCVGKAIGTPLYMSPEQRKGQEGDERSDLYALAIVLYEMLAGHPPFRSDNEYDLTQAHVTAHPPPLVPHVPGVTAQLESAIMIALAKRPESRFASVRDFSDAIGASPLRADAPFIVRSPEHLVEADTASHAAVPTQGLWQRALSLVKSRSATLGRRFTELHPAVQGVTLGGGTVAILAALYLGLAPGVAPDQSERANPPVVAVETSRRAAPDPTPVVEPARRLPPDPTPVVEPARRARPDLEPGVEKTGGEAEPSGAFGIDQGQVSTVPEGMTRPKESEVDSRFARLERAARAGDRDAGYELGRLYLKTPGRQKPAEAFKWFKLSAEAGYSDAQAELGKMYHLGLAEGGKDLKEAARWYTKAADQYNAEGQYWLGVFYEKGAGGQKQDYEQAGNLYNLAKIQKHEQAAEALDRLRKSGVYR
jgi:serine/threonine-protein kinase